MPKRNSLTEPRAELTALSFATLLQRAREQVRLRVRNGHVTERGLALRAGISQPYLHRVLKGARQMTPGLADRLLRELDLSIPDLLERKGPASETRLPPAAQPRATASR